MSKGNIQKQSVTDFMNVDYVKYVNYTISNRAIPSLIDGLKPGARKVLHAALTSLKKGKPEKLINLVGDTFKLSAYHHGDTSLHGTIIRMGAAHLSNSAPLYIKGSGGTLRKPSASAARYLSVMLSEEADLYNIDMNILEHNMDGSDKVEPKYYLPIIPTVLTTRNSGMAIAYSFSNPMSYSIPSIAKACIAHLDGKKRLPELEPFVQEFKGKFIKGQGGRWVSKSNWERKRNSIVIKDLPISMTFDKFDDNLAKLLENNVILDFDNNTKKGEIEYVVHFNKSKLDDLINKGRLEKTLKIVDSTKVPGLNVLDENDKIITSFNSPEDIIKFFTEFRLDKYNLRKAAMIKDLNERIAKLTNLAKFIKLVIDGKIELRNRPIKEIKANLAKNDLPDYVLQVSITKQTKEEYEKLLKEVGELENELKVLENTTIKQMYKKDLQEVAKKYKHQVNTCPIEIEEVPEAA